MKPGKHQRVTALANDFAEALMVTRLSQRHITRSHAIRWSSPGGELPLLPDNTLGVIPQRSESI
jgi:hypothetical protein